MLTALDIRILEALQSDAKMSMQELADRTNSSTTQCWRRVKLLEQSKVITGYSAQIAARAIDLSASAFVQVALSGHEQNIIDGFLNLVETVDQIVECASVTGDYDFMLLVHAPDPEGLETFIMKRLLNSGFVSKTQSNFVLRMAKTRGSLPLTHLTGSA